MSFNSDNPNDPFRLIAKGRLIDDSFARIDRSLEGILSELDSIDRLLKTIVTGRTKEQNHD